MMSGGDEAGDDEGTRVRGGPASVRRFGRRTGAAPQPIRDEASLSAKSPAKPRLAQLFDWRIPSATIVVFLVIDQVRRSFIMPEYYRYSLFDLHTQWRHVDPMPSFWANSTWLLFLLAIVGMALAWQLTFRRAWAWAGAAVVPLAAFGGFYGWYSLEYQRLGIGRIPIEIAPVERAEDYDNPWCVAWDNGRCRRGRDGNAECGARTEPSGYVVPSTGDLAKGWPECNEWQAPIWCLQWRDAAMFWQRRSIWPMSIEKLTMSLDGGTPWMCDDNVGNACRQYSLECSSTVFERAGVILGGFQE